MSMSAVFVQVEPEEAARTQADPSLAEAYFSDPSESLAGLAAFDKLGSAMQDRVRTVGPQMMAQALSRFDPRTREMLEQRLGVSAATLAGGEGGNALLKLMQERQARAAKLVGMAKNRKRNTLSLDKEWHGVHYLLCGSAEPTGDLAGQAVLGGDELGEGEGFSGYGPARLLLAEKVREISGTLNRPQLEAEASGRFDASAMNKLGIYPGFRASDLAGLIEGIRRLRGFYTQAAASGRAMITCIV